jgi:hypothetical protein
VLTFQNAATGQHSENRYSLQACWFIYFLYLQTLWDYIHVVRSCMNEWKKTPWKKIDVENMDVECKKFSKEIRGEENFSSCIFWI